MLLSKPTIKELTTRFADCLNRKDLKEIEKLLSTNFSLFAPDLDWVRGKNAVLRIFQKQFEETARIEYEIINLYEDGNTGILEYKITLDGKVFEGVDFVKWEDEKMVTLRSYNNP